MFIIKILLRYSSEWEEVVGRMGRWIDFKNDYKSMYPWYMESIWWVFKQLFDKESDIDTKFAVLYGWSLK